MVAKILNAIHNYFICETHSGNFEITGGTLDTSFEIISHQFYKIEGSKMNDGIYERGVNDTSLVNETFTGTVHLLAVPKEIRTLASEISAWVEKYGNSPYTSESFGGYSYSKGTSSATGSAAGWQDVFRSQLNTWRKVS